MNARIVRMTQFDKKVLDHLFNRAGETNPNPNADFFKDDKNVLLVSYIEGMLGGFLWAYVLDSPGSPQPKMLLYSIDVFEEFRRQGMAIRLIEELKKIARSYECREIFVPTRKSNRAAMALYTRTKGRIENDDDVMFIYDEEALGI